MAQTPPKGDKDELREKLDDIFDTFNNNDALDIHTLAGEFECMHLTDTGKQMVVDLVERYASQREIEVLERTQRDFVHGESSEAFDEGRQYEQFLNRQLINELKKQKEEQPDVR